MQIFHLNFKFLPLVKDRFSRKCFWKEQKPVVFSSQTISFYLLHLKTISGTTAKFEFKVTVHYDQWAQSTQLVVIP